MDKLLMRLEMMLRYLSASDDGALTVYLESQRDTLLKIYEGRPYVLCTYYIPSALMALTGAEALYIDRTVGLCAGARLLGTPEDDRPSGSACSYQRAFLSLIESGILPKPAAIAAAQYPCSGAVELCKVLHRRFNIPLFVVSEQSTAADLRVMGEWLLHSYGQRQGLSETVDLYNRALGIKRDIDAQRLRYPGALPGGLCLKLFCVENDLGRSSAIAVMQELARMVRKSASQRRTDKGLSVFWLGLVPLYDNNLLRRLEMKTGCSIVFEEMWMFGGRQLSVSSFYEDLARSVIESFFYDEARRPIKILSVMKETGAYTAVNFLQKRCSFLPRTACRIRRSLQTSGISVYHAAADVVYGSFDETGLMHFIEEQSRRQDFRKTERPI